ncbi:Putative ribosomal N-acetyltransferase YdaF [Chryseobacterium aquaeductus]|uniref:Ribosomal N-acetyltransferase YdaF n=1 Tax=Chryseobacterium aquaeductus TaxID=2675056 RepID=A0A9N8MLW6_9FLAO|nr:GNAT family protein [Chryseobacterium aquaeductus]CAA7330277.1 Putative ribosomal N-acetyltransferase YdaF [Chryseobacterium potabilaquae]CAD7802509.1 Putative ribosomal N-acetyltransferase YdaF [Chryseobacterium aquaeductus]
MTLETIETDRLILQKMDSKTMNQIFETKNENEIKNILGITSEEEFDRQKKIHHYGYESYNKKMMNFKIVDKQSSQIIGNCGFHTWNPQHCRAEIGYDLNSDEFKNKGLMKEALEKVIEFGFHEMNLNRIEALIDENNTPSRKLLEHFDFTKEGIVRGHYLVDGIFEDSVLYSLLKSEYSRIL